MLDWVRRAGLAAIAISLCTVPAAAVGASRMVRFAQVTTNAAVALPANSPEQIRTAAVAPSPAATQSSSRADPDLTTPIASAALPKPDADGFITLFNGHDLAGWTGLAEYWSVRDGSISGHQAKDMSRQTFLVFSGLKVTDFELRLKYRFASPEGNSGIQFRSTVIDPEAYRVGGYQADFDAEVEYDGSLYDEAGVAGNRDTLSDRGEKTIWDAENKRHSEPLGENGPDLKKSIKLGEWNDVVLVAHGNHVVYSINGRVMSELVDDAPTALREGVLALQLHAGFTMDVRFKDVRIKVPHE